MPIHLILDGKHRCAGVLTQLGYNDGLVRREHIYDDFPYSQAGTIRHKSPYAAYVKGYYDGVEQSYQ